MAINKKLIHFKTFENFNSQKLSANEENTKYTLGINGEVLNGTPDILYQSIVWIKDVQKQWTHGQLYGGKAFSGLVEITYEELKELRDNSQLVPGQQYRIIDYVTTTVQTDTQSAGHQFDIIVTADDVNVLNEKARATLHEGDTYFANSDLNAWELWYCLDNDTNRFEWAGNESTDVIVYDSSECVVNPELIDDNVFITPFNFESCVWSDIDGTDGYGSIKDLDELIYEWGYFTDENGNTHLCLYKSNTDLYEEEGQPDYGDKYLYRGVITVDGTEYDYWQKWDEDYGSTNVEYESGSGVWYIYATTPRIVQNPEAYSTTEKQVTTYGKGVIYRMIDEWGNDCPYDFKNIQFKRYKIAASEQYPSMVGFYTCYFGNFYTKGIDVDIDYPYWVYTFSMINLLEDIVEDVSVIQYKYKCDRDDFIYAAHTYNNVIKSCGYVNPISTLELFKLPDNVFVADTDSARYYDDKYFNYGLFEGFHSNNLGYNCENNTFDGRVIEAYRLENYCSYNTIGDGRGNSFGNYCRFNLMGRDCSYNSFGGDCVKNYLGWDCSYNSFGDRCTNNLFGDQCRYNHVGKDCRYNSFRTSDSADSNLLSYVYYNYLNNGCSYNIIWNNNTTSLTSLLKNINITKGVAGTYNSYNMINIDVLNQDYEIQVAKNSKGEIKVYCEADLIA